MIDYKNCTYIVTGCTGYVGNVITKKLLNDGCRVVGLARSEEKVKKVFDGVKPEIVYGDVRNIDDLEKLFMLLFLYFHILNNFLLHKYHIFPIQHICFPSK